MAATETPHPDSERPLRADAARNRAKVLTAARKTFAAEGLGADMADVAARAKVGVGTVYRHFPTKEALLAALAQEHFGELVEIAEGARGEAGSAWDALELMLWRTAEHTAEVHGMCEVLSAKPHQADSMPAAARLGALSAQMVEAARVEGTIRPDAGADDIPMMMCGFGGVASGQRGGAPMDWRRYMQIMIDGLRAPRS